jgi:hypothetical protein
MFRRILAVLFFFTGAVLLTTAGLLYFYAKPAGPTVEADTDVQVPGKKVGDKYDVALHLRNQSSKPVRVLGLAEC